MFKFWKKKPEGRDAAGRSPDVAPPSPVHDGPRRQIVPRVRHRTFLEALGAIPGVSEAERPVAVPLMGDLVLAFAYDNGTHFTFVASRDLDALDLTIDRLRIGVRAHVLGLVAQQQLRITSRGELFRLTLPNEMSACIALCPEVLHHLLADPGSPALFLFPNRDAVYFAKDHAAGRAELLSLRAELDVEPTHALSRRLYRLTEAGWSVVEE